MEIDTIRTGQKPFDLFLRWEDAAHDSTNPGAKFTWTLPNAVSGYSRVEMCELVFNENWFNPFIAGGTGYPFVGINIAEFGNLALATSADNRSISGVTVMPTFLVPSSVFNQNTTFQAGWQQLGLRQQSQVKIEPSNSIQKLTCTLTTNNLSVPTPRAAPPAEGYWLYLMLRFYE